MNFPYSVIDLTHTLDEFSPSWEQRCGFSTSLLEDYNECDGQVSFRVQQFNTPAGIGTHVDAPAHCMPHGLTIDQIPLSQLIAPAVVIDVSKKAHESYFVSLRDIEAFEKRHGFISEGTFVLINTGWSRFWTQPERYHNHHRFPCVSKEAAAFLTSRNILGLGIDTLSPDRAEGDYPVHQLLLSAGKLIVENAAHLEQLPVIGSLIMILPMKVKNATEAPIRLLGLIHRVNEASSL
ncbi:MULTISPECIES: cyclase family protein [Legionella]|uniref:Metal-dependent hydrolase n=1 Tax=Legionella maceachernii TaxID=466 RepID=A0A0W0WDK7_9GAMM|nr:cyclase family protein [Legionella maceachernii]KTD30445.1 metal-dependent hydrolase [Legionella maceachernii]SJZ68882.1 Kynurenine formamidase [Legionella maceachernii]SUP02161.1 Kynurenine formamidase [Legionella maceachernii]